MRFVFKLVALHEVQITFPLSMLSIELGYWVKPRSTTWFSRFLLIEFEEDRWLKICHMNKVMLFNIAIDLKPVFQIQNTKYHQSIFVEILVC